MGGMAPERSSYRDELEGAVSALRTLCAGNHGDRVVGQALMNPSLKLAGLVAGLPPASPGGVVRVLQRCALRGGELWTMFKECGGVSKELSPFVDEAEQTEALVLVWSKLVGRVGENRADGRTDDRGA